MSGISATLAPEIIYTGTRPVATTQTQEDDGRTRISVTEDTGNLQGMDIVLPQNVLVNGQRVSSRQIRSQPNRTGVALVDDSAVDMNAVPGHVTRLTNFFRIDPAVAEGNDWIEVVFPELTLPEGRYLDELELYVLTEVDGVDGLLWVPISHGLEITDDDRIMIRIAATGHTCFIGIADQVSGTAMPTFQNQESFSDRHYSQPVRYQNSEGDSFHISCEKGKTLLRQTKNEIDLCTVTGNMNDKSINLLFEIEGLHNSNNNFSPNWDTPVSEHDIAYWLMDSVKKFEEFGLEYDESGWVTSHSIKVKIHPTGTSCIHNGYVNSLDRRRTLNVNSGIGCTSEALQTTYIKPVIAHEYFHHAQSRTGDILESDDNKNDRKWAYEGTATWFMDEVCDSLNSYLFYSTDLNWPFDYLESNLTNGLMSGNVYTKFGFFKLLQRSTSDTMGCNYHTFLSEFFQEQGSSNGSQRLKDLVEAQDNPHQCYFGNALGSEKSNTIAAALDYYSWAINIEKDITKIDYDEPSFNFNDIPRWGFQLNETRPDYTCPTWAQNLTLEPMSARAININDTNTDSTYDQDRRLLNLFVQTGNKVHYTIRDDLKRIVAARDSNSAGYFFPAGTGSNKIDGWYITLINDDPAQPAEVALQIFRTQEDTEFATVRIEEPVNGSVSNNRVIRIRGTADGADIHKVRVNISETGYNVILPVTNGEFDGMITLSIGNNSISVVPMNENDQEMTTGDDSVANITVTGEESDGHGTNALIDSQMAFNLTWDQANDMDIHVWDPLNQRIWYGNRYVAYNGITYGQLDQDNTSGFGTGRSNSPEVVTYFSDMNQHPDMGGCYTIGLHYYSSSGPETNLTLDILLNENSDDRRIYRRQATISQPRSWSAPIHVHCRYAGPGSEMTCSDDPGIYNGGYCEVPDDYPTSTSTSASNLFLPSKY
jgi:hypothetical protein